MESRTEVKVAYSWGPARPLYKFDQPADHAVFNSVMDNPLIGDERYFVRIEENAAAVLIAEISC